MQKCPEPEKIWKPIRTNCLNCPKFGRENAEGLFLSTSYYSA